MVHWVSRDLFTFRRHWTCWAKICGKCFHVLWWYGFVKHSLTGRAQKFFKWKFLSSYCIVFEKCHVHKLLRVWTLASSCLIGQIDSRARFATVILEPGKPQVKVSPAPSSVDLCICTDVLFHWSLLETCKNRHNQLLYTLMYLLFTYFAGCWILMSTNGCIWTVHCGRTMCMRRWMEHWWI